MSAAGTSSRPGAEYGITKKVDLPYDQAVARVKETLKEEGFGVLTEIDVTSTLKQKLDVDFGRRYVILGACNPHLAYEALQAELDLGLLLPCNVIVYETDGGSVVSAVDPEAALGIVGNPTLERVAEQAKSRLARAVSQV